MGKSILLVHGRAPKPAKRALRRLWFEALRYGIERDHPAKLAAFDQANLEFIYYGNISNDFLDPEHDVVRDAASRRRTLNKLKQYSKEDFNRRNYNRLDGKSAAKEFLADTFAGLAHFFRVSEPVLEVVAPDMKEYWNTETEYGTNVRYPMIRPLKNAMDRNDEICVVGHSLGSMIAYDTFWKFSRTGEYRPEYTDKQIDLLPQC